MANDTYWLTLTNVVLGVVTAAAVVAVVRAVALEMITRRRHWRVVKVDREP